MHNSKATKTQWRSLSPFIMFSNGPGNDTNFVAFASYIMQDTDCIFAIFRKFAWCWKVDVWHIANWMKCSKLDVKSISNLNLVHISKVLQLTVTKKIEMKKVFFRSLYIVIYFNELISPIDSLNNIYQISIHLAFFHLTMDFILGFGR